MSARVEMPGMKLRDLRVGGATESHSRVAAFFDLDGTMLPLPSLERRLIAELRARGAMPIGNYFRWLAAAVRLAPLGIVKMAHSNKMHVRGIRAGAIDGRHFPFFPAAMQRIEWHLAQGHAIVLVSGTLEILARQAALALMLRFAARNVPATIRVVATRVQQVDERYTGKIEGEAAYGEAKARAMQRVAAENDFDLVRSYAYGDSSSDRWMLGAVGKPAAVNPSVELRRIAELRHWPVFVWAESEGATVDAPPRARSFTGRAGIETTFIPRIKTENAR
jgi:HAD superfamily phosphoserine phosphatase-like hydrolase